MEQFDRNMKSIISENLFCADNVAGFNQKYWVNTALKIFKSYICKDKCKEEAREKTGIVNSTYSTPMKKLYLKLQLDTNGVKISMREREGKHVVGGFPLAVWCWQNAILAFSPS